MKCPLRIIAIPNELAQGIPAVYDCIKEECAWWIPETKMCSLPNLCYILTHLNAEIDSLARNMPHEHQFRK